MAGEARANEDGSLFINSRLQIPAEEVVIRVTTSGGPGGQHANRSLTRVVATFSVLDSSVMSATDAQRVLERGGGTIRSSAGRFRSQGQNRTAALDQLAKKIAALVERPTPRRPTRPSHGSKIRRVDDKKARGRIKSQRRTTTDD